MINDKQHSNKQDSAKDKLVHGYETMLDKLAEWAEKADETAGPVLINGLKDAENFLHDFKLWSKDEVDLISQYLRRDLHDAAVHMEQENQELKNWLGFDVQQVEEKVLSLFANMTDKTRLELDKLDRRANEWHTGQVTSIGTLVCKKCAKELHFHKPGRIPPCPACGHTEFRRISDQD